MPGAAVQLIFKGLGHKKSTKKRGHTYLQEAEPEECHSGPWGRGGWGLSRVLRIKTDQNNGNNG